MISRHRLDHQPDEHGMTVPELAVVTFILSIVVLMMFSFLDQMVSVSARTERHAEAEGAAQLALRTATQNIRGALPLAPCTSDGASPGLPTAYSNCLKARVSRSTSGVGGCPHTQYVYAVVNYSGVNKLVENSEEVACDGTVSTKRLRRVLLDNLVNTGTDESLFTYFRGNGTAIPATDLVAVAQATSIRMLLKVKQSANAPTLSFAGVVAPRNNR